MHVLLLVLGDWLRNQTEHVIMAVRGRPVVQSANLTTLLKGPFHLVRKNAHSAKTKEFYDFIEKLCPAPRYPDLFSRYRHNERWDCHGDEAPCGELIKLASTNAPVRSNPAKGKAA
jgi:N6-adenosine-specific RNA methylase IME4